MNFSDFDKVCQVDVGRLYLEVMREHLPFFQWPKWVGARMSRLYLESISRARVRKSRVKTVYDNVHCKKELAANHFFSVFSINYDYFYPH